MKRQRILITGSNGQIGTDLLRTLGNKFGVENVIATDLKPSGRTNGPFEILDITDHNKVEEIFIKYDVSQVYHLAALLSSKGEENPFLTWKINLDAYLNILNLSVKHKIERIFFPSTIGVFGETTPRTMTPQNASFVPSTVYGISKLTGELWSQYFRNRYDLDIRGIRYPGVISYSSVPKGGTTDYSVEMFFGAVREGHYTCFLNPDTRLPLVYMPDVLKATTDIMDAPKESISTSVGYNISSFSLSPEMLYEAIKKHIPSFKIQYKPDHRQKIADSWSESIDDSLAKDDWGWKPAYNVEDMVKDMLKHIT